MICKSYIITVENIRDCTITAENRKFNLNGR